MKNYAWGDDVNHSYIPVKYRTRGERYDDIITRQEESSLIDRIGDALWSDSKTIDKVAMLLCIVAVLYFVARLFI